VDALVIAEISSFSSRNLNVPVAPLSFMPPSIGGAAPIGVHRNRLDESVVHATAKGFWLIDFEGGIVQRTQCLGKLARSRTA
jgi:hypothetical protein